jgi:hypothetical protein
MWFMAASTRLARPLKDALGGGGDDDELVVVDGREEGERLVVGVVDVGGFNHRDTVGAVGGDEDFKEFRGGHCRCLSCSAGLIAVR